MADEASADKSMLILKSSATALGAVETFLRNRGWKIHSTTDLKEAFEQIVTQKPSYVLITVDHSNKKVRTLPKLIAANFPTATIVFAETQTPASYKMLHESASEYRVYPPVTGPAIERCINKYLKDQQAKLAAPANENFRSDGQSSDDNATISIKGGGRENISVRGEGSDFTSENASRVISKFLTEDEKADNNVIFAQEIEEKSELVRV